MSASEHNGVPRHPFESVYSDACDFEFIEHGMYRARCRSSEAAHVDLGWTEDTLWLCPGCERWFDVPEQEVCDTCTKATYEDDGEEFLRKMENAADQAAASVPLEDREY